MYLQHLDVVIQGTLRMVSNVVAHILLGLLSTIPAWRATSSTELHKFPVWIVVCGQIFHPLVKVSCAPQNVLKGGIETHTIVVRKSVKKGTAGNDVRTSLS